MPNLTIQKRRVLILLGAVLGALGAALIIMGSPSGGHALAESQPSSGASYSALEASTEHPGARVKEMIGVISRRFGVDVARARGVTAADGTHVWIVPGREHLCLGVDNSDGTGYSCATTERAAAGGLASAATSSDGSVHVVYLVPDEITGLDVAGSMVVADHNLVVADLDKGDTVTATHRDGTRTDLTP